MNKLYLTDRILHWLSAVLLLMMLLNLSAELHTVNWTIKGQTEHRQDAVQKHGSIGLILFVVVLVRLIWGYIYREQIPRLPPKSLRHKRITQAIHGLLYTTIFILIATGVMMLAHYELPLNVYGVGFAADKAGFIDTFPVLHEIHMFARDAVWWIIGLHFVGVMYARK